MLSLVAAPVAAQPMTTDIASVGATSETAADHIAIKELSNLFDNTLDEGDIDGHMQVWAEEMSFASPFGNYDTRDAYREWVTVFHESAKAYGGTRHLVVNNVIAVDGDRARQTCYQIILGRTENDGAPKLLASARMEDEFVRTADGWRFAKRTLVLDQDPARFQD